MKKTTKWTNRKNKMKKKTEWILLKRHMSIVLWPPKHNHLVMLTITKAMGSCKLHIESEKDREKKKTFHNWCPFEVICVTVKINERTINIYTQIRAHILLSFCSRFRVAALFIACSLTRWLSFTCLLLRLRLFIASVHCALTHSALFIWLSRKR